MGSGSGTEAEDIPTSTAKGAVREQQLIDKSTLDRLSTSTALATTSEEEEEEGSTEEGPASTIDSEKAREGIMATEGKSADTVAPTAPTLPRQSASPSTSLPPQSQLEEQNLPQQQESQANETEQDTANTTDTGGSVSASECIDGQENHNNPTMNDNSNTDKDRNTLSSTPTKTGSDAGSPESPTLPTTTATPPESPSPSVSSPTSSTSSPPPPAASSSPSPSSKLVHHRATSRSHIPPFVYDPNKITLRFLFANKDGISVTIDCKPTDTVGEVKGALLSVWPKELPDCSGGDRLRLICMGKGMLMPDTRSLEDCQVPTFKTHATPVNVSIRPESAPVGSYPAQKSSLVGGAGGGRARSGAASRREARGNSGSNGGGGTRTGCSCVIS